MENNLNFLSSFHSNFMFLVPTKIFFLDLKEVNVERDMTQILSFSWKNNVKLIFWSHRPLFCHQKCLKLSQVSGENFTPSKLKNQTFLASGKVNNCVVRWNCFTSPIDFRSRVVVQRLRKFTPLTRLSSSKILDRGREISEIGNFFFRRKSEKHSQFSRGWIAVGRI